MTRDIDLSTRRLTLATDDGSSMTDLLRRVDPSFAGVATLDRQAWPCRFRSADGFLVDLLTPARTRDDGETLRLNNLEAGAAPLLK